MGDATWLLLNSVIESPAKQVNSFTSVRSRLRELFEGWWRRKEGRGSEVGDLYSATLQVTQCKNQV